MSPHLTLVMHSLILNLKAFWQRLNGDAAYERYIRHWQIHHADQGAPLNRKAFFAEETRRKWNGVKRCC